MPKSGIWARFKSLVGFRSDSTEQPHSHSTELHLDSMSDLLIGFISGGGEADQLISHIVKVCQHIDSQCVVANPTSKEPVLAPCMQADVHKVSRM